MDQRSLRIYFFTGTGNAEFAAHFLAGLLKQDFKTIEIVNIAGAKGLNTDLSAQSVLLFCFPTHGFNAPPIVLRFLFRFPKGKLKCYFVNTRAGMKLFNWRTPGLGGMALWLPAIILRIKGYKPKGFTPLDMPSNWISLHPALRGKAVEFIVKSCEKDLKKLAEKIKLNQCSLTGFYGLWADLLIAPIAIGYYFYGRFILAKTYFANTNCTMCRKCIRSCPVHAIAEIDERPYWKFTCENCMRCMNNCPEEAIETGHGFVFAIWWLAFALTPLIFSNTMQLIWPDEFVLNPFIIQLFDYALGILIIFLGYRGIHYLLRFKIFNKLMCYLSFTNYSFWGRYTLHKNEHTKSSLSDK